MDEELKKKVRKALENCWSEKTSICYSEDAPASYGQCAPTAIVVWENFGGEILKTDGWPNGHHFYNRINGERIDFTEDQFTTPEDFYKIEYKDIQTATENQMTAEIFLDFFRQANDQLRQQNETQIGGAAWRKGFWNVLQAEYYLKKKEYTKSVNMLAEVLEGDDVPEKYKKEAKALMKKMSTKIIAYIVSFEKKLKDKEKRGKYVEFMRLVYKHFTKFEEVTDKIKEVCKENKISKKELMGEK